MKTNKQIRRLILSAEQIEDRQLGESFVGMSGALPCRPTPRQKWDEIACGRAPYKGRDVVHAAREAMRAAIALGTRVILEQTAERITHHFRSLEDAALRDYRAIVAGDITLDEARMKASKETTEALHALMASALGRESTEFTVQQLDEAITALCDARERLVAEHAQLLNQRPALARMS